MPEFGLLDRTTITTPAPGGEAPAPWTLAGARLAQVTFEVAKRAALSHLPPDVSKPLPAYARLIAVDAPDSPAGPLRLAALCVSGRYAMTPRNVVVRVVVDGPADAFGGAFGGPLASGRVTLERTGTGVSVEAEDLAAATIPEIYAIDPGMLRWDGWLAYAGRAGDGDGVDLVALGLEPELTEAYLSKGAVVEVAEQARPLRSVKVISACYVEGDLTLGAPEVQQRLR